MDWLSDLFMACFIFGLVFTIASFLIGGLGHFDGLHFGAIHGAHLIQHFGHSSSNNNAHPIGHELHSNRILGWLNLNALIVFVTWFGGIGIIGLSVGAPAWIALLLAVAGGVAGYFAILLFLNKILFSSETPFMVEKDYDLTGTVARVSSPVFENGVGEVIYTKFGTRRSAPARSSNGDAFPKDLEVVILKEVNGVVFVADLGKILEETGAEKWSTSKLSKNNRNNLD